MKLRKAFLMVAGCSSIALGGPVGPPGGAPVLNQDFPQPNSRMNISSATFRTGVRMPFLTPGLCHTTDATGAVITIACGSGTVSPYSRSGFSSRFGQSINVGTSTSALDLIFAFSYQGPGVTLGTTPGATTRELGTNLTGVVLSAFTVETSSPITLVRWTVNGTIVGTQGSPTPTGATEVYTDTNTRTTTTAYRATAGDGTSTTTSSPVTFTFVYPFYYGVGAQSLTFAQVQGLNKLVQTQSNITTTTSPSSQVYYFAYPQAYGVLNSILDQNGFETIAGYTRRSGTMTMLDATVQNYYVYEFNSPTTQTSFSNTYKF
jgi:hypothetical protein